MINVGALIASLTLDSKGFTLGLTDSTKHMGKFQKAMTGLGSGIKSLSKNLFNLKSAFIGLGLGMVVKDIMATGAAFEQTMTTVKGVSGATEKQFAAMIKTAKSLGESTEFSAKQAGEGLLFLSMAGFDANNSIKALPGVLELATAGNIELGRAADIASNALTAMRLDVDQLSMVNDVFVRTITTSNTNMEMMAESFKYSAPVAAAFGMEITKLSALIGLLGNAGIQGSMAGTQLAVSFGDVHKVFKKYGVSATNADGSTKDLVDALQLLEERGAGTTEIMEIFGERAGRAMLALLGTGTTAIRKYIGIVEDYEGASTKLATMMRSTLLGAWKELKSVMEAIKISIFEENVDALNEALRATTKYIRENKEQIVGWTVSLTNALPSLEDIAKSLGKIKAIYDALPDGVIGAAGTGIVWRVLGGSLPVASLVAGLAYLVTHLDDLRWSLNQIGRMGGINQIIPSSKDFKKAQEQLKGIGKALANWVMGGESAKLISAEVTMEWNKLIIAANQFGRAAMIHQEVIELLEEERKKAEALGKAYLVLQKTKEYGKKTEEKEIPTKKEILALYDMEIMKASEIGEMAMQDQIWKEEAWLKEKKIKEEKLAKDIENMDILYAAEVAKADMTGQLAMLEQRWKEEAWKQDEEREKAKKQMAKQGAMDMLQNSAYFFKEMGKQNKAAFKLFKAFSIAETIVSTIEAAQHAFKAGMMTGGPWAPVIAAAYAAAAIMAGMARVAQIKSIQPEGGGGGISAGGAGPAVGTYPVSPTTGIPEFPGEAEAKPSLTVVVQGDFYGEEEFVNRLAERLSEAVENRSVRVVSSEVL
uniref:Putative tail protein n=1 Tax=viral metagenome TaxID=1070528 RepID=A0A6M3MF07_9ZZZZ